MDLEDDTRIPADDEYEGTRISTGSDRVDRALRGGIPLGSMTLIEGPSASGKSVLCQHIAYGALMADLLVVYYTSKATLDKLVSQMSALGLDISDDVESDQLRIFPLDQLGDWRRSPRRLFGTLLTEIKARVVEGVDVVILDDPTPAVSRGDRTHGVNFFAECLSMSRRGLTVLTAIHTSAFDKELIWRFHRLFDAHISLDLEGQKRGWQTDMDVVNLMEVKKVENLSPSKSSTIYFRVNPELGASMNISLEVLPIYKLKV